MSLSAHRPVGNIGINVTATGDAMRDLVRQIAVQARGQEHNAADRGPWELLRHIGDCAFQIDYENDERRMPRDPEDEITETEMRALERELSKALDEFCDAAPPLVVALFSIAAEQLRDQIDGALPKPMQVSA